jgi:hypothetical protein
MGYYLGQFYFDKRDLFILLGLGLLVGAWYSKFLIPFFSYTDLFVLILIFLLAKGILLPASDSFLFLLFFSGLIILLFFPLIQVLFFLFIAFFLLRLLKFI